MQLCFQHTYEHAIVPSCQCSMDNGAEWQWHRVLLNMTLGGLRPVYSSAHLSHVTTSRPFGAALTAGRGRTEEPDPTAPEVDAVGGGAGHPGRLGRRQRALLEGVPARVFGGAQAAGRGEGGRRGRPRRRRGVRRRGQGCTGRAARPGREGKRTTLISGTLEADHHDDKHQVRLCASLKSPC